MKNEKESLPVLYKILDNTVVALFPTIPYDRFLCLSYEIVGQHGGASLDLFNLKSATPEQYSNLHRELSQIYSEYDLRIVKRVSSKMNQARINKFLEWRNS